MKQLMAGGGVALIGITLIPLLSGLFGWSFPGGVCRPVHIYLQAFPAPPWQTDSYYKEETHCKSNIHLYFERMVLLCRFWLTLFFCSTCSRPLSTIFLDGWWRWVETVLKAISDWIKSLLTAAILQLIRFSGLSVKIVWLTLFLRIHFYPASESPPCKLLCIYLPQELLLSHSYCCRSAPSCKHPKRCT